MEAARKILVVDDEAHILRLCGRLLAPLGCEVVFADSVAAVSARLAALDALDMLLTDIMLPDGNGFDVIRAARAKFPAVNVLVMTGLLSVEEWAGEIAGAISPERDIIFKPFAVPEFQRAVRARLGPKAANCPEDRGVMP